MLGKAVTLVVEQIYHQILLSHTFLEHVLLCLVCYDRYLYQLQESNTPARTLQLHSAILVIRLHCDYSQQCCHCCGYLTPASLSLCLILSDTFINPS